MSLRSTLSRIVLASTIALTGCATTQGNSLTAQRYEMPEGYTPLSYNKHGSIIDEAQATFHPDLVYFLRTVPLYKSECTDATAWAHHGKDPHIRFCTSWFNDIPSGKRETVIHEYLHHVQHTFEIDPVLFMEDVEEWMWDSRYGDHYSSEKSGHRNELKAMLWKRYYDEEKPKELTYREKKSYVPSPGKEEFATIGAHIMNQTDPQKVHDLLKLLSPQLRAYFSDVMHPTLWSYRYHIPEKTKPEKPNPVEIQPIEPPVLPDETPTVQYPKGMAPVDTGLEYHNCWHQATVHCDHGPF